MRSAKETFESRLKKLNTERQKEIMGTGRFDLWKDEGVDPRSMVYLKPNQIWGPAPAIKTINIISDEINKRLFLPVWNPFEIAKNGGKYYGVYLKYSDMPVQFSRKSLKSINEQINRHKNKIDELELIINDIEYFVVNEREKLGMIRHWKRELVNFIAQRDILDSIIKIKEMKD